MPLDPPLHVTTGDNRRLRSTEHLVVHRRAGFAAEQPYALVRGGLPTTRLERSLVDGWPLLSADAQRAPAIVAVQRWLTTPARIGAELDLAPSLKGRARLLVLLDLLARGCRSELETWGYRHVFDHPSLPPLQGQLPVRVGTGMVYLDVPYPDEMVDVELDGAAYRGDGRREADVRRDAALASIGWLPVRFTHARLHADPVGVRVEVRDILAVRRRQLGLA